jgi:hypothetical protein
MNISKTMGLMAWLSAWVKQRPAACFQAVEFSQQSANNKKHSLSFPGTLPM